MLEVQLNSGTLRYIDQGQGQPIMFLHGALANSNTWHKVFEYMPKGYRCIAPDLPLGGHSLPFHKDADLSPIGIARTLNEFIELLGLDNLILVGNDTGGAYAQVFASLYPEYIAQLVLSNCDAFEIFPPKKFAALKTTTRIPGYTFLMAQLFRYKPFLKTPIVLGLLSKRLSKEDIYKRYVYHFIQDKRIRADFKKVVQGWSTEHTLQAAKVLKKFEKPVRLIWGTDDIELFPIELGKRLEANFLQVTFQPIDDSLTYVQEDQPQKFVQALLGSLTNNDEVYFDNHLRAYRES